MNRGIFIAILFAAALLPQCQSSAPTAGGDGGPTSEVIAFTGAARYEDGRVAAGAHVSLRPENFLADTVSLPGKRRAVVADVVTDDSGRFRIDSVDTGRYAIEIGDGDGRAVLLRVAADGADAEVALGSHALLPTGAIGGTVYAGIAGAHVRVYGLERMARVAADGGFLITDLPAGDYTLHLSSPIAGVAPVDTAGIAVSGTDTVRLENLGREAAEERSLWKYRAAISLDASAAGAGIDSDVVAFPLCIRLTASDLDFSQCAPGGADIRFDRPDGTPAAFEIESWDAGAGTAALWVLVDTVVAGVNRHYLTMYWGASRADSTGSPATSAPVSLSNGSAVFDTADGFAGVWHLGDTGSITRDATVLGNHGVVSVEATGRDGVAGAGRQFNGVADRIDCGSDPSLDLVGDFTVSAWVRLDDVTTQRYHRIISKKTTYDAAGGFELVCKPADNSTWPVGEFRPTLMLNARGTTYVAMYEPWNSGWNHCAVVVTGSSAAVFFNGHKIREASIGAVAPATAVPLLIGSDHEGNALGGNIDEVRVEHRQRSDAWIRLCFETQRPGQRVVRVAALE